MNGTVDSFSNSNTGTLIITGFNKTLEVGDIVTGDKSNATFTVKTLSVNSINAAAIVITPTPNSSTTTPDDEFGFSETITEYPDTL